MTYLWMGEHDFHQISTPLHFSLFYSVSDEVSIIIWRFYSSSHIFHAAFKLSCTIKFFLYYSKLNNPDTIFIMAFAIILLNTDLHTPNLKPEKKMKPEDFVRNLRGIDGGADVDRDTLLGIYERIRNTEFKPGSDHVTQVPKSLRLVLINREQSVKDFTYDFAECSSMYRYVHYNY